MTGLLAKSLLIVPGLDICSVFIGVFHAIGREEIPLKEIISGCFVTIIFGALIGLTIGVIDTLLIAPFM